VIVIVVLREVAVSVVVVALAVMDVAVAVRLADEEVKLDVVCEIPVPV
jgi:hypothetical protein